MTHPTKISRLQARKAVQKVKAAKTASVSAKKVASKSVRKLAPSIVERYLGHFGVGSTGTSAKKSASGRKRSAKTASARKSMRKAS